MNLWWWLDSSVDVLLMLGGVWLLLPAIQFGIQWLKDWFSGDRWRVL